MAPGRQRPVRKVSRLLPDYAQIEERSHMRKDMTWSGCYGYKMASMDVVHGLLEQEDIGCVGGCFDIRARFACCSPLQLSSTWARITSSKYWQTRELVHWDVRATVLHGDGVEFGVSSLGSVEMYANERRSSRRVDKKERSCSFLEK